MKHLSLLYALLWAMSFGTGVQANPSAPRSLEDGHGKGYWWYKDKHEKDEEIVYVVPEPEPKEEAKETPDPEEKDEDKCAKKETWTDACGFVHPGNDFDFQAKQRDVLLNRMVMNAKDQDAVEDFQYYMRWMVQNAIEVARTWQFNKAQNPDLDPEALYPVSHLGLRLASELKTGESKEIFDYIKESGGLFYFTKSDCIYCHEMAPWVLQIGEETGIEVWNTALDEHCIDGFDNCVVAPETIVPATALEVKIVPSLYLFIEPDIYIRVASGFTAKNLITGRIVNYFNAYRTAALRGVDNGSRWKAPVDFSADSRLSGSVKFEQNNEPVDKKEATQFANKYLENEEL